MTKKNEEEITLPKTLKWKLKESPSVENLVKAVEAGILTKEEAHQIAVQEESQDEKLKLLEDEVELLKDVIKRMAQNQPMQTIIKHVHEYEWPRYTKVYPAVWMSTGTGTVGTGTYGTTYTVNAGSLNTVNQVKTFVSDTLGGGAIS